MGFVQASDEEWRLRPELADCYQLFAHLGWGEAILNHITLRVPGPEVHYCMGIAGETTAHLMFDAMVRRIRNASGNV